MVNVKKYVFHCKLLHISKLVVSLITLSFSVVCEDGFHNGTCSAVCGKCVNNEFCDKETGECENGCHLQFKAPMCQGI